MLVGSAYTSIKNCLFVFGDKGGLVNAKPFWISELGDLGASPLRGSHDRWDARCVDKLFPGRRWTLVFITGVRGKKSTEVPIIPFRPLEKSSQLPDEGWLETQPWVGGEGEDTGPSDSSYKNVQSNPFDGETGSFVFLSVLSVLSPLV